MNWVTILFCTSQAVRDVAVLLHSELLNRQVVLELELAENLPRVRMHLVGFQQVLMNLAMNGLEAMEQSCGRTLKIITTRRGHGSLVEVHDAGPGISEDWMDQLFTPFHSTKPGGLGLGLSISRSIMETAGGELLAANHPEGGAVFQIILPSCDSN